MKTAYLFLLVVFVGLSCRDKEIANVNHFLDNIQGSWQLAGAKELVFPGITPSTPNVSIPQILRAEFDDCAYRGSGNNCYATIQFNSKPALQLKYRADYTGKAIQFVVPNDANLSTEEAAFLKGPWLFKEVNSSTIQFEQRTVKPYYSATLSR